MLSTTTGGASQSTNSDTAEEVTTIAVESTALESSKTVKAQVNREPFTSLSPENAKNQSKTMLDEVGGHAKNAACRNSNNNNSGSGNPNISNTSISSVSSAGPEVGTSSGATSSSGAGGGSAVLRQNSTSSVNSPPTNAQNGSDHSNTNSNSSSVSASLGQTVESDLSPEELAKKKQFGNREDDSAMLSKKQSTVSGIASLDKESQNNPSACNVKGNLTSIGTGVASTTIKEEPADLLGSLGNMKKEENFSPSMSPVGFGSLGSIGAPERSVTPIKIEINVNNTKAPTSISLNNDDIASCNILGNTLDTDRISEASSSSSGNTTGGSNGPGNGQGHGHCGSLGVNSSPSSGQGNFINNNTLGSCLDYMQQQNHIFVFSTQLANKGAESVLSGQFQTIIAYHCTQPATKSFLEDFFMKNPMKMNKLQRQNSLGLGLPVPAVGQIWHNINASQPNNTNLNTNLGKSLQPQQKLSAAGAKSHFNNQSDNGNKRTSFPDNSPASSLVNEGDLMCWETGSQSNVNINRNHLEGATDPQALKLIESVDSVVSGLVKCNSELSTDNNIISLQGVKVPDENLTPQQRQHREEQLAKIKKMNQFLFPENDKLTNTEPMSNMMMNVSGPVNSQLRQMQLQAQVQSGQKPEHVQGQLADDALMPIPLSLSGDVIGEMGAIISCNSGQKGSVQTTASSGASTASSVTGCGIAPALGSGPGSGIGSSMGTGSASGNGNRPGNGPVPGPASAAGSGSAPAPATGPAPGTTTGPCAGQGHGPIVGQGHGPIVGQGHGPGPSPGPGSGPSPGPGPTAMQCSGVSNTSGLNANSPEIGASYGNANCGVVTDGADKGVMTTQEGIPVSQGGMTQAEWTKMQQQFYEERLKGGKGLSRPSGIAGPISSQGTAGQGPGVVIQQQPVSGVSGVPIVNSSNPSIRNNVQGPPPPYHPTQRSASVPIATQSPNPSSPNNLSLPSPRTAGALGLPSNSPNMELSVTSTSGNTSTTSAMSAVGGTTSKNCFQIDNGSPSSRHRSNSTNVMNHQLNSNPSTPLSHLSPKDLESFNPTSISAELKCTRPSPQRLRSPGNGVNNPSSGNHLNEPNTMDSRFPVSSPGLNHNFNTHAHLQNNPNTAMNAYKGPSANNPLEVNRQNCGPGPVQFVRRSDNMPLNPNSSNRPPQNKMTQNFDPISSLAQMSQQLTSCVSNVGSPAGGMNMIGQVSVDMNIEHSGIVPSLDSTGMDQMNHGNLGNAPGNCHSINPIMNTMGQRMLSPKICGLGSGPNGVVRDGSNSVPGPGFHGILTPGTRMMGRMPINFGQNFSPNIQVKASTPNTIQYMPVRSQNNSNSSNNNGGNIRMPPSIEFLQRYANPQLASSGGAGPLIGHTIPNDGGSIMIGSGPLNLNSPSEQQQQIQSKIGSNPNSNTNGLGMNFFQNCNQIPVLDDDSPMTGGSLTGHEIGLSQGPMVRGMRPHGIRQHSGLGSRMQAPGPNIGNRQHGQFNVTPDGLDCNDPTVIFNNVAGPCNNTSGMFAGSQQGQGSKPHLHKPMPSNMCQTQVGPNIGMQGPAPVQVQGQGLTVMGGGHNNSNLLSTGGNSGVSGGGPNVGVNFVGPSSNDLKYAQQYHSFQQQLYATNTRSQQHQLQQQGSSNMIAMPPNLSPNPTFFVNK